MGTPAQIAANRLNSQKSTGPRSVEGKAASRFNALKHAASAKSLVIPGENEANFAELAAAYHDQFQPVGPEEALLLEKIVAADWTQRRMDRLENEVLNALMAQQDESEESPLGAAYIKDCQGPNALHKIFRRREAASREWYRARKELRDLQARRVASEPPPQPAVPQPLPALPENPAPVAEPTPFPASQTPPQQPTPRKMRAFDESTPPAWRL